MTDRLEYKDFKQVPTYIPNKAGLYVDSIYLTMPSLEPVHTISLVIGTIQSIDRGWPGNRSLIFPHSPQLKMLMTPSEVPHKTFWFP